MPKERSSLIHVRPVEARDHDALLSLAPRLTVGMAPWLAYEDFLGAAQRWITGSIEAIGPDKAVFVAEDAQSSCVGFVSVQRSMHFTGREQAYIGELAVAEEMEGLGVGRALLASAEAWAREQDLHTVVLDTGAANVRARRFYEHLGYAEESVKLVKVISDN